MTNNKDLKILDKVLDVFPISEHDKNEIEKFKTNHDNEAHPEFRGFYSYSFTPMPLGFLGTCKCEYCGAEHKFISLFS